MHGCSEHFLIPARGTQNVAQPVDCTNSLWNVFLPILPTAMPPIRYTALADISPAASSETKHAKSNGAWPTSKRRNEPGKTFIAVGPMGDSLLHTMPMMG